jgi:hypothetical protein
MPDDVRPEEIARGLSAEQAEHLAEIAASPYPIVYLGADRMLVPMALRSKGLVSGCDQPEDMDGTAFVATDLGVTVAALRAGERHDP